MNAEAVQAEAPKTKTADAKAADTEAADTKYSDTKADESKAANAATCGKKKLRVAANQKGTAETKGPSKDDAKGKKVNTKKSEKKKSPAVAVEPPVPVNVMIACLRQVMDAWQTLIAAWRVMDKDNNGSVTEKEFAWGLKESGVSLPAQWVRGMWNLLDKDGSGDADYKEMRGMFVEELKKLEKLAEKKKEKKGKSGPSGSESVVEKGEADAKSAEPKAVDTKMTDSKSEAKAASVSDEVKGVNAPDKAKAVSVSDEATGEKRTQASSRALVQVKDQEGDAGEETSDSKKLVVRGVKVPNSTIAIVSRKNARGQKPLKLKKKIPFWQYRPYAMAYHGYNKSPWSPGSEYDSNFTRAAISRSASLSKQKLFRRVKAKALAPLSRWWF